MGIILDCCFDEFIEDSNKNIKEEELQSIILHVEPNCNFDEYEYEEFDVVL
jgi:hypothetical protein